MRSGRPVEADRRGRGSAPRTRGAAPLLDQPELPPCAATAPASGTGSVPRTRARRAAAARSGAIGPGTRASADGAGVATEFGAPLRSKSSESASGKLWGSSATGGGRHGHGAARRPSRRASSSPPRASPAARSNSAVASHAVSERKSSGLRPRRRPRPAREEVRASRFAAKGSGARPRGPAAAGRHEEIRASEGACPRSPRGRGARRSLRSVRSPGALRAGRTRHGRGGAGPG